MESNSTDEEKDMTDVKWSDLGWLSHFGLSNATALEYFSLSQFYNRNCNNELIKMQRLDRALLSTMTGIEYALESTGSDEVFIIVKRKRTTNSLITLATYYIIKGEIFQAPNAATVIANRFTQSMSHLQNAFVHVRDAAVRTATGDLKWHPAPGSAADNLNKTPRTLSVAENRATSDVLFDVFQRNHRIHAASARRAEDAANVQRAAVSGI